MTIPTLNILATAMFEQNRIATEQTYQKKVTQKPLDKIYSSSKLDRDNGQMDGHFYKRTTFPWEIYVNFECNELQSKPRYTSYGSKNLDYYQNLEEKGLRKKQHFNVSCRIYQPFNNRNECSPVIYSQSLYNTNNKCT